MPPMQPRIPVLAKRLRPPPRRRLKQSRPGYPARSISKPLHLNRATKPLHRPPRFPRPKRISRRRSPAPRHLQQRRLRWCGRFRSLPRTASRRQPESRQLTVSPRIKLRNRSWNVPRRRGDYGSANKPAAAAVLFEDLPSFARALIRARSGEKKKWVAGCHPFLFGRPV